MANHVKKKSKVWILVCIVFFLMLIFLGILFGSYVSNKLSYLNIRNLDDDDLAVNSNLYEKVSGTLTKSEFNNIKNIVLFGIDTQSEGDGQDDPDFLGRTDTIMIVSINPKYKSLKMISIPRDTYAEIEGNGKMKINHAYALGEEQLAIKTINQNFGLDITEYVTIDFEGLVHVINDIGGISLKITQAERDFINDSSKLAYEVSGNPRKKVAGYGTVTLDGEQALTHSRNRSVGDDFTRAGRQREVLEAILTKMSTMSMGEISDMLDVFLKEVTTNINVSDYIGTITEVIMNKDTYLNNIISAQVPSKDYATGQYIKGIYYFVPSDTERMKQDMIDYLYRK